MKVKLKKLDLTYDQGRERQRLWYKLYREEMEINPTDNVSEQEILNWLSMNFHVLRKLSKIQEL